MAAFHPPNGAAVSFQEPSGRSTLPKMGFPSRMAFFPWRMWPVRSWRISSRPAEGIQRSLGECRRDVAINGDETPEGFTDVNGLSCH